MLADVGTFVTKSAALLAIVVGLAAGSYGIASAATSYGTPPVAQAMVFSPGLVQQRTP
jgi:hypothetical protein